MKGFIFAFFALFMFSCSSVNVEDVKLKVADGLSMAISQGLECTYPDQVKNDIYAVLKVKQVEAANSTYGMICEIAVGEVLPVLLKEGIPSSWGCNATMAQDGLKKLAETVCSKI
jgi:hypothetical protein